MAVLPDEGMARNITRCTGSREPSGSSAWPCRMCAAWPSGPTRPGELPVLTDGAAAVPFHVSQPDDPSLLLTPLSPAAFTGTAYAQSAWLIPSLFGEGDLSVVPFTLRVCAPASRRPFNSLRRFGPSLYGC